MNLLPCILFQPKCPRIYHSMRLVLPVCRGTVVIVICDKCQDLLTEKTNKTSRSALLIFLYSWFFMWCLHWIWIRRALFTDFQSNYHILAPQKCIYFLQQMHKERTISAFSQKTPLMQWVAHTGSDACPLLLTVYKLCMLSALSFFLEIKRTATSVDHLLHNAREKDQRKTAFTLWGWSS